VDPILAKSVLVAASRQTLGRRLVPNARQIRLPITRQLRATIVQSIRPQIREPPTASNVGPPIVLPAPSGSGFNALVAMPGLMLREDTLELACSVSLASRPTSESVEHCFIAIDSTQASMSAVLSRCRARTGCETCQAGTYSEIGAFCVACEAGYTSEDGATECMLAPSGSFSRRDQTLMRVGACPRSQTACMVGQEKWEW
jgi:hypothetical protein